MKMVLVITRMAKKESKALATVWPSEALDNECVSSLLNCESAVLPHSVTRGWLCQEMLLCAFLLLWSPARSKVSQGPCLKKVACEALHPTSLGPMVLTAGPASSGGRL